MSERVWTTSEACAVVEGFDGAEHDEQDIIAAWQHLIDTGACWSLQGWYGRQAMAMIEAGACRPSSKGTNGYDHKAGAHV